MTCSLLGKLRIPLLLARAPGQACLTAYPRLLACPRVPCPRLVIVSEDNGGTMRLLISTRDRLNAKPAKLKAVTALEHLAAIPGAADDKVSTASAAIPNDFRAPDFTSRNAKLKALISSDTLENVCLHQSPEVALLCLRKEARQRKRKMMSPVVRPALSLWNTVTAAVDATARATVAVVAFVAMGIILGAVEMRTQDMSARATSVRRASKTRTATSIALMDCLLGVLLVVSQVGSTAAYHKCSSDADCQYDGCNNIPCSSTSERCVNGFFKAFCVSVTEQCEPFEHTTISRSGCQRVFVESDLYDLL